MVHKCLIVRLNNQPGSSYTILRDPPNQPGILEVCRTPPPVAAVVTQLLRPGVKTLTAAIAVV
jgi:hypothetical protein